MLRLLTIISLCFFANMTSAATARPCRFTDSTDSLKQCLEREYQRVQKDLSQVFIQAYASIDTANPGLSNDSGNAQWREDWKSKLQDAQKSWDAFKQKDCIDAVGYEWKGMSSIGAAIADCLIEKTKIRTEELRKRYSLH
jgi:uncharacterized protein YecT (DUF1311 family)